MIRFRSAQRVLMLTACCAFASNLKAQTADTAYAKVAKGRADKIVAGIGLTQKAKANRVSQLIAAQYISLNNLQGKRDNDIKAAVNDTAKIGTIKTNTDEAIKKLHAVYVTNLKKQLTPVQVEGVKNGMTYNTVPLTYANYLLMLPYLSEEQQAQIKTYLTEAREFAIDGGTAKEKQQWFGKYKGKIAIYLAKQGYDLKKEGNEWAKRRDTSSKDAAIKRANEVVKFMALDTLNKSRNLSVQNLVAFQYQKIVALNAERNAQLKKLKDSSGVTEEAYKKADNETWLVMKTSLEKQRDAYFEKMKQFLDAPQIEKLRNAMTNDGLNKEYDHFLALLPGLKNDQKKKVYDYLTEARDNAVNVLSSREINQWFAKFRGRANNYLAAQGYNLRKATEELEAKTGKPQ